MPDEPLDTDKPSRAIVRRLSTVRGVRRELANLYADARTGPLLPSDASKLAHVLSLVQKAIESSDVEKRLTALEEAIKAKGASHG